MGIKKIFLKNYFIAGIFIVLLHRIFRMIRGGAGAFWTASAVTCVTMGAIVFVYANLRTRTPKDRQKPVPASTPSAGTEIRSLENCTDALLQYMSNNAKTFHKYLSEMVEQVASFKKKKGAIASALRERFGESEISYAKFAGSLESMEKIMILNIRGVMNKINAFDEEEYEKIFGRARKRNVTPKSEKLLESRKEIYEQYLEFASKAVDSDEEILIRLDRLLLEIGKLSGLGDAEIGDMRAMREIDALISDAKWYRD